MGKIKNKKEATTLPPTFAEKDLDYYLRMVRGSFSELAETQALKHAGEFSRKNIVLFLTSEEIGKGHNPKLGKLLILELFNSLIRYNIKPKSIILSNSAVNLACDEEREILNKLTLLNEQGINILICNLSACENGKSEKIRIGKLASMDEICENLLTAWKVITL